MRVLSFIACALVSTAVLVSARAAEIPVVPGLLFTPEEMKRVRAGEVLTRVRLQGNSNYNMKSTHERIAVPKTAYTYPALGNHEMVAEERAFIPFQDEPKARLHSYNLLLDHTLMSGMKYYSHTAGRVEPLILEGCRIHAPTRFRRLRARPVKAIEPRHTGYFFVRDNRLGVLVFRTDLFSLGRDFIIRSVSEAPVTRLGVEVSGKGDFTMVTFLMYDGDAAGFYYYSLHALRIRSYLLLKSGTLSSKSFANRIRAYTVFTARLFGHNWQDRLEAAK